MKFVGWLNLKARIEVARWPFTENLANVETARHALAVDERRRPFAAYRIKPEAVAASGGRFQEMWFAGVHGDVGGEDRDDDQLPDIAFSWMVKEAAAAGFAIDPKRYKSLLGVGIDHELLAERALGVFHPNSKWWRLARGWLPRTIGPGDAIHPSVRYRIEATKNGPNPYRPPNLPKELQGTPTA